MFQAGEWIVCDHNGVCRILDITQMPELKKGVLYYELEPAGSAGSRIYAPVDGGRLVFLLVEAVRGKPVPPEKEGMVHFAGFVLLMVLMVVVMFNDVSRLLG